MRIIYLHQYFNTPEMSGGTRSFEMARRLVSWGHDVQMITSIREDASKHSGWVETKEAGISVHWFPVPYSNRMSYRERIRAFFSFAFKAAKKAASLKGDVIFATSTPLTIAIPAVYAAKRRKIPMVFEVRDLWPELPIAMGALNNRVAIVAARKLESFAYRNSTRVVALSPGMRDGVVKTGYPSQSISVIPNSCDLELFDVPKEQGESFRARYSWLQDRPLVVYTGTLGKINGVSYLVKLAAAVKEEAPDVRFLVVGSGQEEEKVLSLAKELGVYEKNFFHIGRLPKSEIPSVLSAADIATSLFLNIVEMQANSANKFFDALAAGRPIAINYGGWQAEIIKETNAGLVLHPESISKAKTQLLTALKDKTWLTNAGEQARRLAQERFARDNLAKELERVLIDVAGQSVNRITSFGAGKSHLNR